MAKDRTLKAALSRHKGIDHQKERQKKLRKQAEKQRRAKQPSEDAARGDKIGNAEEEKEAVERGRLVDQDGVVAEADRREAEGEGWETDESEDAADEDEEGGVDLDTFEEESESESEEESFTTAASNSSKTSRAVITSIPADRGEIDDTEVRDEGENDIPLSDLDVSDADADIIPHQRLTINNTAALTRSLRSFALPSHLPFSATQTITSSSPSTIPDIDDDLNRELAFYKQCLDAVREARILLKREGVPFTRPADYFAEMVKSEEQMGRVRAKVLDAAARSKASADARRQRDLKKFGKAVQVARAQERAREKKEVMGRIESLKRSEYYLIPQNMHCLEFYKYLLPLCEYTNLIFFAI